MLIKANYPEVEEFESYFLAIENGDEPNRVMMFKCNEEQIKGEKTFVDSLIATIENMKPEDYKPRDVKWEDAFEFKG